MRLKIKDDGSLVVFSIGLDGTDDSGNQDKDVVQAVTSW